MAGLKCGSILKSVNQQPIDGLSFLQVSNLIRRTRLGECMCFVRSYVLTLCQFNANTHTHTLQVSVSQIKQFSLLLCLCIFPCRVIRVDFVIGVVPYRSLRYPIHASTESQRPSLQDCNNFLIMNLLSKDRFKLNISSTGRIFLLARKLQ